MYNKNGILLANAGSTTTSLFPEKLKDFSGNDITTGSYSFNTVGIFFQSSSMDSTAVKLATKASDVATSNLFLSVGYRESSPTENTYEAVFTEGVAITVSGSNSYYRIITLTNNGTEDIQINEIDCSTYVGSKGLLYAIFPIQTLTLSPGDSFSFSILRK